MIFLDHCLDDSPIKSVSFSFHFYIHRLHRRHCPPLSRRNKNKLTFLDYQFRHSFLQVRFTHLIVPLHLFSAPRIHRSNCLGRFRDSFDRSAVWMSVANRICIRSFEVHPESSYTTPRSVFLRRDRVEVERFNEYEPCFLVATGSSYYSSWGFTYIYIHFVELSFREQKKGIERLIV